LELAMTEPDDRAAVEAQAPIDETDLDILDELADLYTTLDPVPAGLVERIQFAVALDEIDIEVMRLVDETPLATGARGERSTIFTFSNSTTTLTIRIVGLTDDTVRVDGWVAPPSAYRIVLRTAQGEVRGLADDDGRFVFDELPTGLAQLVVRRADEPEGAGNAMATTTVLL
jgi:hypothetical protein